MVTEFICPWLIMPLLLTGGLYLCFEGAEKLAEKWLHSPVKDEDEDAGDTTELSVGEYEQKKVAGAIRTDFILSAEIIVIALGTVQNQNALNQILVMSFVALLMTAGVYGIVAAIVKLDDLGFYLERHAGQSRLLRNTGKILIHTAPRLMKLLTVVGTAAMFLVGGSLVVHQLSVVHHLLEHLLVWLPDSGIFHTPAELVAHSVTGLMLGMVLVIAVHLMKKSAAL